MIKLDPNFIRNQRFYLDRWQSQINDIPQKSFTSLMEMLFGRISKPLNPYCNYNLDSFPSWEVTESCVVDINFLPSAILHLSYFMLHDFASSNDIITVKTETNLHNLSFYW